uniref:Uncharacterized protein n=1 Tax=Pyxicephalus adspersus TaxID=30357 RepID=A0AAV3A666_PYXAD|nr:TPA: hypothetical protein GDO54_017862 [Pyxicephalus adspersus]
MFEAALGLYPSIHHKVKGDAGAGRSPVTKGLTVSYSCRKVCLVAYGMLLVWSHLNSKYTCQVINVDISFADLRRTTLISCLSLASVLLKQT